jgi:hypothetical protein
MVNRAAEAGNEVEDVFGDIVAERKEGILAAHRLLIGWDRV